MRRAAKPKAEELKGEKDSKSESEKDGNPA
jgi:hypothetical protein